MAFYEVGAVFVIRAYEWCMEDRERSRGVDWRVFSP